jgi:hypothetical protein
LKAKQGGSAPSVYWYTGLLSFMLRSFMRKWSEIISLESNLHKDVEPALIE